MMKILAIFLCLFVAVFARDLKASEPCIPCGKNCCEGEEVCSGFIFKRCAAESDRKASTTFKSAIALFASMAGIAADIADAISSFDSLG